MLVLDGGDALYRKLSEQPPSKEEVRRARIILEVMGKVGTDAMAVGPREVAGGLKPLRAAAMVAKVPLLSANLLDKRGKRVFPASTVFERGGRRIGVVGISTADLKVPEARAYLRAGLTAGEPIAAVKAATAELEGKADLVVLLGRLTAREMREVVAAVELPLAFIGSTGQVPGGGSRVGQALVYDGGFRGQAIQRVGLRISGQGLFQDRQEREIVPRPVGLPAPNDARATAIYLDTFKVTDPAIDALLEPVRSEEEQKARPGKAKGH